MLPHLALEPVAHQHPSKMTVDELDAACRAIAAEGGELGDVATRILAICARFEEINDKLDRFLNRPYDGAQS